MYDIRQRSMLDGWLFTLAGLAKRTGRRRVRQRCAGLNRTGLAGPPQDNIAAELSVAADRGAGGFRLRLSEQVCFKVFSKGVYSMTRSKVRR